MEYWKERVENIKNNLTLIQIFNHFGIVNNGDIVAQIHCPFHGEDKHPSARIYETNTMYCWVCTKAWDVISFTRDYLNITFSEACSYLEQTFSIDKVDIANAYVKKADFLFEDKEEDTSFDGEILLNRIQELLIKNRSIFSYKDYVSYFYKYDDLFYRYNTMSIAELKIPITNMYKELLKII